MKAIIIPSFKGGYKITETEIPRPNKDEVLVKVKLGALCYRDLLQLQGYYPRAKYPLILGHEMVGVIEDVGENVEGYSNGDRVTTMLYVPDWKCDACKLGEEYYCKNSKVYSQELDGFFAEYALVKWSTLVKIPSDVGDEAAVVTPCVSAMVLRGLKRSGIREGDYVLVTGAGGGVGVHAVQMAKALGGKVIAVTSSEDKAKFLSKIADHVIVGNKFSEDVRKIGDVRIVIDNVGPFTFDETLRVLKQGGKVIQIGNIDPSQSVNLRLGYLILKNIEIIGHAGAGKRDIEEALSLAREGKWRPVVSNILSFEEIEKGLQMLREKSNLGKILLRF
ncbi:alcohol dehydrogenase [Candidatus Acidianus copahuensis]|uniref:Alcohol dehydrogenase n=1 Tax=Candidatus Acidianus copahuensis TaxID=1160895 RepID=A0A031LVC8_9CREN|nr:acryloyl-coenzyme A reductase [Candidatus Acidianus copahuensis]EZQ11720.1 alcohol dehydrogenase [Candidatus Acidianus copahuensis]